LEIAKKRFKRRIKSVKVGVLSGGGDAPGINAVIRAVVRKGILIYGDEMIGIQDGWRGLVENKFIPLNLKTISGLLPRGGSILGTSRTNPFKREGGPQKVLEITKQKGIGAVVVIGGDDTLGVANKMTELGLNCVGVPKTIDNDLSLTDYTFGFQTAVQIACEAIDRLHTTAEAHHRVMILEVMGRYTGWIALEAGIAGGADVVLIPEKPFDPKEVCQFIQQRVKRGKMFSLVVVAEGAKPKGSEKIVYGTGSDEFGHPRLGGVGYYIGKEIEKCTGIETRVVVLGHLQRGGSPIAYDRVLATRYGIAAIDLVHKNQYGKMVALKGNKIVSVLLKDVIGKRKTVDLDLYELSKVFSG
jgi:phosphofructokinase-like protein